MTESAFVILSGAKDLSRTYGESPDRMLPGGSSCSQWGFRSCKQQGGQSEEIEKRLFYGTTFCRSQYLSRYKRSITGLLCLPFYLPGMLLVRRHEAYSLLGKHCDQYYGYWC